MCLQAAQHPPEPINMDQTLPPSPSPTPDPDIRICHPATPASDAPPTRPVDGPPSPTNEHPTLPSPTPVTDEPTQATLAQYTQDPQAIPSLLHAIEPHMMPTLSSDHRVAVQTDPNASLLAPAAQVTPSTPHPPPPEPDQPPHTPPRPQPTADQDHSWRLRPYPLTIPSASASPRWQQLLKDPSNLASRPTPVDRTRTSAHAQST
jgi:hypothetical protein